MIETSIFHKQIYRETVQDYTNLVDKAQMLFSVVPAMIILYRESPQSEWRGHLKNTLVEPIKEEVQQIKSSFLIIPEATGKFKKDRVKMVYHNPEMEALGVNKGDELVITPNGGFPFWIEGKEYWWVRNSDIYAIAV
jgi:co-chaperonin GroES (HSP10)